MKIRPIATLLLSTALLFSLGACKKKKDQFAGMDGDYVSGTPLADRNEGASFFGSNVNRNQFQPVYFGYDSFSVDSAEMSKLQQVAQHLGSSSKQVIVAGFTDERGTAEYNRGLGERRALAVREQLIQLGVNAGSIQTVSFGAEMPADPGSGDSAWAMNRRAEFGLVE